MAKTNWEKSGLQRRMLKRGSTNIFNEGAILRHLGVGRKAKSESEHKVDFQKGKFGVDDLITFPDGDPKLRDPKRVFRVAGVIRGKNSDSVQLLDTETNTLLGGWYSSRFIKRVEVLTPKDIAARLLASRKKRE